ncbi:hypothetical protein WCE55_10510 [Luteimonas sp. MJ293]|uniref:hypothetical protein n=1 Tax=Luteimonas sp. MJ146 TaxID=3129240 RepID=UPI0031BAB561
MLSIRTLHLTTCAAALCLLLPAAQAANPEKDSVRGEIRQEMAEARREVRAELAAARIELQTGNLDVGNSLRFGKDLSSDRTPAAKAEITPDGDFLIDGVTVAVDGRQRLDLLAYRGQVIDIALAGMDIGEQAALAAIDSVDRGLFRLMVSALSGRLERDIEKTVTGLVEPVVLQICDSLPALYGSQQRLAGSVAEFGPYATLDPDEIRDCEADVRREFAGLGRD